MKRRDIQWYDHRTKSLRYSQRYKILKFLEYDCIKRENRVYLCRPIPGYNVRTYTIVPSLHSDVFYCNCQYFVMTGSVCSHIGAVREHIAREERLFYD